MLFRSDKDQVRGAETERTETKDSETEKKDMEGSKAPLKEATGAGPSEAQAAVPKVDAAKETLPSYRNTSFKVVFDEQLGKDHDRKKYVRYQLAPRENWGPMSRAK